MENNAYFPQLVYDHIMRFYAEKLDRELRDLVEEAEKPKIKKKKNHTGFDNTNKFFNRGKW